MEVVKNIFAKRILCQMVIQASFPNFQGRDHFNFMQIFPDDRKTKFIPNWLYYVSTTLLPRPEKNITKEENRIPIVLIDIHAITFFLVLYSIVIYKKLYFNIQVAV